MFGYTLIRTKKLDAIYQDYRVLDALVTRLRNKINYLQKEIVTMNVNTDIRNVALDVSGSETTHMQSIAQQLAFQNMKPKRSTNNNSDDTTVATVFDDNVTSQKLWSYSDSSHNDKSHDYGHSSSHSGSSHSSHDSSSSDSSSSDSSSSDW